METPELDKMSKVQDDSQVIGEFLEWATSSGYNFTQTKTVKAEGYSLNKDETYEYDKEIEAPVNIEKVLAEFFEIDLDKANAEREAVFAAIRAHNEED